MAYVIEGKMRQSMNEVNISVQQLSKHMETTGNSETGIFSRVARSKSSKSDFLA